MHPAPSDMTPREKVLYDALVEIMWGGGDGRNQRVHAEDLQDMARRALEQHATGVEPDRTPRRYRQGLGI